MWLSYNWPLLLTSLTLCCIHTYSLDPEELSRFQIPGKVSVTMETGSEIYVFTFNNQSKIFTKIPTFSRKYISGDLVVFIPSSPIDLDTPGCLPFGAIGITLHGIPIIDPHYRTILDRLANSISNSATLNKIHSDASYCDGQLVNIQKMADLALYSHLEVACLAKRSVYEVVGVALDGYPIYGSTDDNDISLTAEELGLDDCHGRHVGGKYRYHVTFAFPYVIGCYKGRVDKRNIQKPQLHTALSKTKTTISEHEGTKPEGNNDLDPSLKNKITLDRLLDLPDGQYQNPGTPVSKELPENPNTKSRVRRQVKGIPSYPTPAKTPPSSGSGAVPPMSGPSGGGTGVAATSQPAPAKAKDVYVNNPPMPAPAKSKSAFGLPSLDICVYANVSESDSLLDYTYGYLNNEVPGRPQGKKPGKGKGKTSEAVHISFQLPLTIFCLFLCWTI